jgi:hypothetical protein
MINQACTGILHISPNSLFTVAPPPLRCYRKLRMHRQTNKQTAE